MVLLKDVICEDVILKGFMKAGKIKDWQSWIESVPDTRGVYAIVHSGETPQFLEIGTGGHFKGKNPNVDKKTLQDKWNKSHHKVLYIGRAGKDDNKVQNGSTIRSRIKAYMRYGNGKCVGHRGGRYIWQLENSDEFEVFFMPTSSPQTVERLLIEQYAPFANLKDGDK